MELSSSISKDTQKPVQEIELQQQRIHDENNDDLQEVNEPVIQSIDIHPLEKSHIDGIVGIKVPAFCDDKKRKRKKTKTIWKKIWIRVRYILPILLIATMVIITNSIDRKESTQKKKDQSTDYQQLFQVLEHDTPLYKQWETRHIDRKFFIFNWTNPNDIDKFPNIKPEFDEVGPFIFRETLIKANVQFNISTGNQVSFNLFKTWTFNREASVDDLDIAVVNSISGITNVHDLLTVEPMSTQIEPWFYHRNTPNEYHGYYTIFTGKEDRHEMNQLLHPHNEPPTTLGDLWSTVSTPDFLHPLNILIPEVCLILKFDDINVNQRIRKWSSNCIEHEPVHDQSPVEKCKTVKKIKQCRGRTPVFLSFPHFYIDLNYKHDQTYLKNVNGLKPDQLKHSSYVTFELETGRLIDKKVRLQFNAPLKFDPSTIKKQHLNVTEIMLPIFWYEETLLHDE